MPWLLNNPEVHLPIQAVLDFHTQFVPENVYKRWVTGLYVIQWVPFSCSNNYGTFKQ